MRRANEQPTAASDEDEDEDRASQCVRSSLYESWTFSLFVVAGRALYLPLRFMFISAMLLEAACTAA